MTVSVLLARTEAECASVRALVDAHVRFERSDAVLPEDWAGRMAGLVNAGRLVLFLAVRRGAPIGYATVTHDVSTWSGRTFAHLDCLFVDDGDRGRGTGRLLFDAVLDHARSVGCYGLQWQTPAWNEGAIRFYRRTGAVNTTKERFTLPL